MVGELLLRAGWLALRSCGPEVMVVLGFRCGCSLGLGMRALSLVAHVAGRSSAASGTLTFVAACFED